MLSIRVETECRMRIDICISHKEPSASGGSVASYLRRCTRVLDTFYCYNKMYKLTYEIIKEIYLGFVWGFASAGHTYNYCPHRVFYVDLN